MASNVIPSDPSSPEPSKESEDPSKESEDPSKESEDPSKESEDPSKESEDPSKESEDPSKESEDPSKESEDPSSISDIPNTSGTPPPPPGPPDIEEIEIISSQSSSVTKPLTSWTASSPTAPIEEPEDTSCCDHIDKIECDATPLNVVVFIVAMSVFVLRAVLYKIGDLYYEVIVLALCVMAGSVLTCVAKRGYYAKVWTPSSPKARVPRPNSAEDFPMEPLVPKKMPVSDSGSQKTLKAIVHHEEEDTQSSLEESASSPKSVSSGSDKPIPSTSDPKKDVKSEDVKTETPSSSPVSRAYKFLFKKH